MEIQGIGNYGGIDGRDEGDVITKPLSIYQKKLSANTLYIVYGEEAGYTYTGQQITPEITVYYGNAADVRKARNAKETSEDILTTPKPDKDDYAPGEPIPYEYGLTRLYASRGEKAEIICWSMEKILRRAKWHYQIDRSWWLYRKRHCEVYNWQETNLL